jgi:hypothetical protein
MGDKKNPAKLSSAGPCSAALAAFVTRPQAGAQIGADDMKEP